MADEVSRPMKYPYTLSAKIAQFPYKHYYKHSWAFKYFLYSTIICLPIFYKIQKMSYSPENVKKWDEIHRKEFSGADHH
ncbi:uncharacterized protein LOC100118244 [Nasonia vitripennis]|uniref:Uncharacterized protein n=1 Tax=Nasonia vitripennis TaxID=7425 RepID=A0A7M7R0S9_NASVI|nr:uncharacterized protein LOC100118244 [Nasonia vitripennis]XP_016840703.1 uncharacterized protein LOC100118244 [Nasonia vitripennis]XP_032455619.1 uncharacterized protein LOC100118244 [Nasonia vitripennis]